MIGRFLDQGLDIAPAHELRDQIGLTMFFADVVDGHDVGVVAQPAHGLGFAADAGLALGIQAVGFDQRERHIPIQLGIVTEVDPLLPAFAEETDHAIAAVTEGSGLSGLRRADFGSWIASATPPVTDRCAVGS